MFHLVANYIRLSLFSTGNVSFALPWWSTNTKHLLISRYLMIFVSKHPVLKFFCNFCTVLTVTLGSNSLLAFLQNSLAVSNYDMQLHSEMHHASLHTSPFCSITCQLPSDDRITRFPSSFG